MVTYSLRLRHDEFTLRRLYRQDRAGGLADHFLRGTAEDDVLDSRPSVSADDDQVDIIFVGVTDNLEERGPLHDHRLLIQPLPGLGGNGRIDAGDGRAKAVCEENFFEGLTFGVAAVSEICVAIGLELAGAADVDSEVLARAGELDAARAAKDFDAADRLRAELQSDGWTVETTKDGTIVRR